MSKTDIDLAGVASIDFESALIRPALAAPPPVCMSVFRPEGQADSGARLYGHGEWQPVLARLLADERISIVGHNFAYDACLVLQWAPELRAALFAAYDQGRILDTGLAQRLVEIETGDKRGKLALDQLGARYGLHVDKGAKGEDGENVRLGFGKFFGLPAAALPPAYRDYALGDADATHRLLGRILQRGLVSRRALAKMARSDLALKLVSAYGLVVDADRVTALEDAARETLTELQGAMIAEGFMRWERGKPQPVRTMAAIRRAVAAAYGIPVDDKGTPTAAAKEDERTWRELVAQGVITDKGNVSTSKLVLEESGEPLLEHLGEYGEWAAVWNKDLKVFRWCAEHGMPIHSRFGFAGTLRSTCSGGGNQKNAVVAVPGMNCFDGETEILTPTGWTRFSDLRDDQEVAQWEGGRVAWVRPLAHQRAHFSGDMVHVQSRNIDLLVTPDHRCLVRSAKGIFKVVAAREYPVANALQPQTGLLDGTWDLSAEQIAALCAFQADGCLRPGGGVAWAFSKARKADRLRETFARLGWPLHEYKRAGGFEFYAPVGSVGAEWLQSILPQKVWTSRILELSERSRRIFRDEIFFWDGCWARRTMYASKQKINADLVQAVLATSGVRARVRLYRAANGADSWQVDATNCSGSHVDNRSLTRVPWAAQVYCVTVPSGFIVIRRGQNVMVTGQSQNLRKKEGVRECITSRHGALVATDYTGLENGTLAQTIVWALGRRGMADKINAGHNFHAEVGCHILGREPTVDNMRALLEAKEAGNKEAKGAYNAAKPLNFGLPGFMQKPETVQSYARIGYKVDRPVDFWRGMIDLWYRTQHDQVAYLKEYVESCAVSPGRPGSLYNVSIPGTDIVRRGATRTAAANTGFQGLGAVVATEGLYLVVRAQMLGKMPGKACAFVHDEVISDCARDDVEQTRYWQEKLMLAAASALMPDLKMKVASVAMTHWSKEASASYDAQGKMQVTEA